jgi:hypothetical protein
MKNAIVVLLIFVSVEITLVLAALALKGLLK